MICNVTKNCVISKETVYATSLFVRGRGMIGRRFDTFDAMVFQRCNSIHTMFMSMNLDVLFLDQDNRICDLRQNLAPWQPIVRCGEAATVVEMPQDTIARTNTEVGDILDINVELTDSKCKELAGKELLAAAETAIPFKEKDQ